MGLDGSIAAVAGVLPAAIGANARDEGLICPAACGAEAAWASPDIQIVAANSLIQIANHFKGTQVLSRPQPRVHEPGANALDLRDIKGQESAKRALEIAAAGGHHLLMSFLQWSIARLPCMFAMFFERVPFGVWYPSAGFPAANFKTRD